MEVCRRHMLPLPRLDEALLFTNFHERGFTILASNFLHGLLRKYGCSMLPPMWCHSWQALLSSVKPS
jgi:hypothetical protein